MSLNVKPLFPLDHPREVDADVEQEIKIEIGARNMDDGSMNPDRRSATFTTKMKKKKKKSKDFLRRLNII